MKTLDIKKIPSSTHDHKWLSKYSDLQTEVIEYISKICPTIEIDLRDTEEAEQYDIKDFFLPQTEYEGVLYQIYKAYKDDEGDVYVKGLDNYKREELFTICDMDLENLFDLADQLTEVIKRKFNQ